MGGVSLLLLVLFYTNVLKNANSSQPIHRRDLR
jgi:hypothetical protein